MNRKVIIGLVVALVVVLAIGGALLMNRKGSSTDTSGMQNMNTNSSNSSASQPVHASSVSIKDFAFSPAAITVAKGTTVTWTNNDTATHTVTENDSQTGPASDQLTPGQGYSFTFTSAGTFHYHCAIHPDMTGTVVVTE